MELPQCVWDFPDVEAADESGVVAIGADLEPSTIVAAYRRGLFPMPLSLTGPIAWWSPDPRGVIPLDGLRVSRSLARSCRHYEVRFDTAFAEVVDRCRFIERPGGWITPEVRDAYCRMYDLGIAHSVETWRDDRLVGGLYGVRIDGLFAGESMFHLETDASKVALVALVDRLRATDAQLLDVQWCTDHLASLGAVEIGRRDYLERLATVLD